MHLHTSCRYSGVSIAVLIHISVCVISHCADGECGLGLVGTITADMETSRSLIKRKNFRCDYSSCLE